MATTPRWKIAYETNYALPADTPALSQTVANSVEAALSTSADFPIPYSALTRDVDVPLTADAYTTIPWQAITPGPPGTSQAFGTNGSIQTMTATGLFLCELSVWIIHGTIGTTKTFDLKLDRISGSSTGESASPTTVEQVTSGWSTRIDLSEVAYFAAGDTFSCQVRPVGSAATAWTLKYARFQMTQQR